MERSPCNAPLHGLLAKAEIRIVDDRGRGLDFHALRVTCGSLLIQRGVELRAVQAVLRHSTPTLTANTYSDLRMVPTQKAVDTLGDVLVQPDADTEVTDAAEGA